MITPFAMQAQTAIPKAQPEGDPAQQKSAPKSTQQPAPSKPQEAAPPKSTAPSEALSKTLKKTVAFLTVEFVDGQAIRHEMGTAFFVSMEDKRLGENRGWIYLVTNRHMAEPDIEGRKVTVLRTLVRLNLKNPIGGAHSEEGNLPIGQGSRWFFPKDDAVDLAVMPDQERYDYMSIPTTVFATKDIVESENIAEGDTVLFTGFFYQFPGQDKIQPILRQGILAMMPDEPLETTRGKPGRLYLADAHVFGGNSGAPLFVNTGGIRQSGSGNTLLGIRYRLLGIVSGYFYETQDFQLQIATTLKGKASANSGISLVVPVDELKTLLESPELQAKRDSDLARERK
jgi:S1-C subfamily serine protease